MQKHMLLIMLTTIVKRTCNLTDLQIHRRHRLFRCIEYTGSQWGWSLEHEAVYTLGGVPILAGQTHMHTLTR